MFYIAKYFVDGNMAVCKEVYYHRSIGEKVYETKFTKEELCNKIKEFKRMIFDLERKQRYMPDNDDSVFYQISGIDESLTKCERMLHVLNNGVTMEDSDFVEEEME